MLLVIKLKGIIKGIYTCTQKDTIFLVVSVTYVMLVLLPLSFVHVLYEFLTGFKKPHTKVFQSEISVNDLAMIKITGKKGFYIVDKSLLNLVCIHCMNFLDMNCKE